MFVKSIPIPPYEDARLDAICISDVPELKHAPRPAVVIFPGGGYHYLSAREAEPVAMQFLAAGFATFIMRYSVAEKIGVGETPIPEAALAIRYLKENAAEFNIDPERIFLCGFSAGGHAAAALGVYWNSDLLRKLDSDTTKFRPTGMILSYPVITGGDFAHKNSVKHYFNTEEPTQEQIDFFSLELHVTKDTIPTFLWHTVTDGTVPVKNSLMFANALLENGVPFEMHVFPEGVHGLSLASDETSCQKDSLNVPHVQPWLRLAIDWTKGIK